MLPVIDISRHQGSPFDFATARRNHVAGVIFRACHATAVDVRFSEYVARAEDAGYGPGDRGVYTFANPSKANARDHADALLAAVERVMGSLDTAFMLDVETYWTGTDLGKLPVITGPRFAAFLAELRDHIESRGVERRRVLFYSNASFWNVYVGSRAFGDHGIIVARYPTTQPPPVDARLWASWVLTKYGTTKPPGVPMGWDTWDGWQFSAGGNKAGPTYGAPAGDLDLNIVRAEAWASWTAPTSSPLPPLPQPAPLPPEDDEMLIRTRFQGFANVFSQNGSYSHLTAEQNAVMAATPRATNMRARAGYDAALKCALHQSGLDRADLTELPNDDGTGEF